MKIRYSFIWLSLFGIAVNGQVRQPHSLYFMETIPQISQMNPAFQPRANSYVILPANINVDYRNDLAVKDIFQKQGRKWYTPVEKQYDYDLLYKSIGKKATMFNVGLDWDIFGLGFRTGNGYFSLGLSEHISVLTALPSDLFKIVEKGLPEMSLDFSPLRTQAIAYTQIKIGYSHRWNDQLTIGINVKPLFGQVVVATKIDKFKMHTGEQQWDFDAKGNIYSSLPVEEVILDENDKIYNIKFKDSDDYKTSDWINQGFGSSNPGVAIDIGATYKIDERLVVSAALNNLGFISWKNDLNGISFNGKYAFNGLEYDTSKDYDDFKDLLINLGDSVLAAMDYKVQHDKFKTPLAPVFHAGATYSLSKSVSVGFLSRSVFWQNAFQQSFNLSVNLQPYSFVAFNAGATWQVKSNVYLGGGLTFFVGPLQVYLLTDYIPILYSTVRIDKGDEIGEKITNIPARMKGETVRVGVNLVFGKQGYVNKPMLDKGKSSWN